MPRPLPLRTLLPALLAAALLGACGGSGDGDAADTGAPGAADAAAPPSSAAVAEQPLALADADLEMYERGLEKEIELVRAAQQRGSSATTAAERSAASQAQWKEQTMPEAARAIGADSARYIQVREAVHEVLQTLDFQGKIDGPMQMDTSRATPEMKARLARDPIAGMPAASAAAFRARLDRLAEVFVRYVRLTAVAG